MSAFLGQEYSNYTGEPVYLYEFRRGSTSSPMRCLYSSGDRNITVSNGDVYVSTPISNKGAKQKGQAVTDSYEIDMPDTTTLASWYQYTPPSDVVYVVVRKFHYGNTNAVVVWIGTIVTVGNNGDGTITATCQAVSVSLKRQGLRLAWMRGCPHALYDYNCRADKSAFAVTRTVTAIGANSITVNASLAAVPKSGVQWPGGFIEWTYQAGSTTTERRLIEGFDNYEELYPYGDMDGYTVGMTVTLYPGCLRTSAFCDSFFNNLLNYGGYEYMPNQNLYTGDPVF